MYDTNELKVEFLYKKQKKYEIDGVSLMLVIEFYDLCDLTRCVENKLT